MNPTLALLLVALAPELALAAPQKQAPPKKEPPSAAKELEKKQAAFSRAAPPASELESARKHCVGLLLKLQESLDPQVELACEWPYEGVYRVQDAQTGKSVIPPGYRVGGTAIVCTALLRAEGSKTSKATRAAIERSLDFIQKLLDQPLMQPEGYKGYDVRGWGHTYALEFLLELRTRDWLSAEQRTALEARIRWLIEALDKMEHSKSGGWNYARTDAPEGASPFMTAPALQFLFQAQAAGFEVPDELIARGLSTLEAARGESGAIQYSTQAKSAAGKSAEEIPAAVARMPIVEVTLQLAGRGSQEGLQRAIESFFLHWEWLEVRRRQNGTHIPPYNIAPYYFFYGHRYVAQAIEFLPEEQREAQRQRLYQLLWAVRESSGGWNDRVFPRSENFGTAMTLLALLEPSGARPASWQRGSKTLSK